MTRRTNVYLAIVKDTWREARSRHVTRILLGLVLFGLAVFLFAADVNVEDGRMHGCGCFGQQMPVQMDADHVQAVVRMVLKTWYWIIFVASVVTSILVSSSWVPQTFTRGTLDRFLARPVSRTEFLLVRQASSLLVVVLGHSLLVAGVFLITGAKTEIFDGSFLLAAFLMPLLVFIAIYGYMTLVGILTESVPVCAVTGFAVFVLAAWAGHAHKQLTAGQAEVSAVWKAVVGAVHFVLPRVYWMAHLGSYWVKEAEVPWERPIVANTAVTAVVFALACLAFRRRDY